VFAFKFSKDFSYGRFFSKKNLFKHLSKDSAEKIRSTPAGKRGAWAPSGFNHGSLLAKIAQHCVKYKSGAPLHYAGVNASTAALGV
jgi:hypothetical protein